MRQCGIQRCIDLAREALELPPGPAVEALRSLSVSEQDRVWQNVQRDLAVYTDDEDEIWDDADEFLIAKYIAGTCSPAEREEIENAIRTNPELRECVELALGFEVALIPPACTRNQ